nr:lysyl oxidase family protein [Nocardioides luti]
MHWDARTTHQHWHFEDFARYSLLRADKTEAVRSKKEAFCLANTDAVDQTVPNANWNPENTDLSTSCGDYGSLSIREVLASGWGDTYGQFRAGQSFNLDGLPNGKYYIAVIANPENRLVEGSTANNVSLRKVILGGKPGARTVRVPQVGVIEEPVYDGK